MELPVTGAAYTHPSQDTNFQKCINWYPTEPGPDGVGKATLLRTGGLELLTVLSGTEIRGMYLFQDIVYVVSSGLLYKLEIETSSKAVTTSLLGSLINSTGLVKFANNPTQLILVDGTEVGYIYTPLTSGNALLNSVGGTAWSSTIGPIGGTSGDTYNLSINGVIIYTIQDVSTALTAATLTTQINTLTNTHKFTATHDGNIITLTSSNELNTPVSIVESGTGFTSGSDGFSFTASPTLADSYNLTVNGVAIYTSKNVAVAISTNTIVSKINEYTDQTNVVASVGADDDANTLIVLTNTEDDSDITVVESGQNFIAGTDGITKTSGDFSTGTVVAFNQIPDSDFLGGSSVVFANGYFAYNEPNSARVWNSALNDGYRWNALDVITAESQSDDLVGLAINKGEIWAFGEKSIEIFYDAANASGSPFSPRVGLEINTGCVALGSIVEMDNLVMWLDHRRFIVQSDPSAYVRDNNTAYSLRIVSTAAINAELATYKTVEDAVAMTYVYQGKLMYQISFPTEMKTWVYVYPTNTNEFGTWHERLYFNEFKNQFEHHLCQHCVTLGPLTVAGGNRSGNIYLMGSEYLDDAGDLIHRVRTTAHYPTQFHNIGVDCLELRMLSGSIPLDTPSLDPQVMMRYSNDGGHTWSHQISRSIGKQGHYGNRITWNCLGSAIEWLFEFRVAEKADYALIYAAVLLSEMEID